MRLAALLSILLASCSTLTPPNTAKVVYAASSTLEIVAMHDEFVDGDDDLEPVERELFRSQSAELAALMEGVIFNLTMYEQRAEPVFLRYESYVGQLPDTEYRKRGWLRTTAILRDSFYPRE